MDKQEVIFKSYGVIPYEQGLQIQRQAFEEVSSGKSPGIIVLCQHTPVFTLGKSANPDNLLADNRWLLENDAEVFKTERGGDITFHGPGQLVVYPILKLEEFNLGVKRYVNLLEEVMIQLCDNYGIAAERIEGLTGIWITGKGGNTDRKIGAIGIKISHGVSLHGLAFNVNTQMDYFHQIIPCGIDDKAVTSLCLETGKNIAVDEVSRVFGDIFLHLLLDSMKFPG